MKKKLLVRISYTFIALTALAGCHKFIDLDWHKHNPDCRIKKLTYGREFDPLFVNAVFHYNSKGNPTSVVYDYVSTARPNLLFRYDHKGRLKEFIAPYNNDNYELWFKYEHDHKGRIISDTQNVFGTFIDSTPAPSGYLQAPGFYEYDMYDRISKITRHYPMNTVIEDNYEYNSDGNLERIRSFTNGSPSGIQTFNSYDDKVNIFRTNKIWMFVGRNYSKNNQIAATSYNSKGLPTQFNSPVFGAFWFLHETDLSISTIEYQCK